MLIEHICIKIWLFVDYVICCAADLLRLDYSYGDDGERLAVSELMDVCFVYVFY